MLEQMNLIVILKIQPGQPGYVYNFNTQNLITFEENSKYKEDMPLVAYIDFETTAPTHKIHPT